MRMRTLIAFVTIVLGLGTSQVLAQPINATFSVTGHLGVAVSSGKCTSLAYPAMCPSGHDCVCYTATKTSIHTASGGLLIIPPGKTQVAVSVDQTDKTSAPGCKPAWGEVQYVATAGPDTATVEFFAALCPPLAAGSPKKFAGGGALTNATLDTPLGTLPGITGLGTATGTYFPGVAGQNLTLDLTAVVAP
jgi:hypothetical protein